MIDLFHLAANDQSVYYLGRIFGVVGTVIPESQFANDIAGPAPIILDRMFKVLNGVALTVGVLIITYTTIVGLFATASEGEFLGKKWSGLWVPIRTIIGIAGLFPSSGGYCAIQVILMWMIIQGISAADLVWSKALEVINVVGNPTAGINTPNNQNIEDKFQQIFISMVCQETAKQKYDSIPANKWGGGDKAFTYYCNVKSTDKFCANGAVFYKKNPPQFYSYDSYQQFNFGPIDNPTNGGACGYVAFSNPQYECKNATDPNSVEYLKCLSSRAQDNILPTLLQTLQPIAEEFAKVDHDFIQFYETEPALIPAQNSFIGKYCLTSSTSSPPTGLGLTDISQCCTDKSCEAWAKFFQANTDVYGDLSNSATLNYGSPSDNVTVMLYQQFGVTNYTSDVIKTTAAQYVDSVITKPLDEYMAIKPKEQWIEDATKQGWLMAGGYFMRIVKTSRDSKTASEPRFDIGNVSDVTKPMDKSQRNNLKSAATLVQNIAAQNKPPNPASAFTPADVTSSQTAAGYDKIQSVVSRFMHGLTERGDTDPIVSIAETGYEMMISAQLLFVTFAAIAAGSLAAGSISGAVIFGNGVPTGPLYAFFTGLFKFLGPLVLLLISTLFTVGALLGVYVPLIPYIVFTVTSIGWFIGVIEAMVAAPFVALGIMSPGGHHELMSKAEPSIMILFNLFLRPTLMVFGMIAAILLSWSMVRIVNAAFEQVMYQIISAPGLIEQIVFMCAYTILIVTLMNKCYSLIHMLPERTLTYIGGHAVQFGEEQALQAVKGGVEGASAQMAKSGRAAAYGAMKTKKPEPQAPDVQADENNPQA